MTKHSEHVSKVPGYNNWRAMVARCRNPKSGAFSRYGGVGIRVCERWLVFANFRADMPPKPSPEHSLDRIDSGRGYEPGNVRWATRGEQQRNKRNTVRIDVDGRKVDLVEASAILGICTKTLDSRVRRCSATTPLTAEPRSKKDGRRGSK